MPFSIDLGPYNAVFAVPTALVDTHMRLAGAVQLKVLLYLLRHAGHPVQEEEMAQSLGVSAADIKDALFYWQQAGLLPSAQEDTEPASAPVAAPAEPVAPAENAPLRTEEPPAHLVPAHPGSGPYKKIGAPPGGKTRWCVFGQPHGFFQRNRSAHAGNGIYLGPAAVPGAIVYPFIHARRLRAAHGCDHHAGTVRQRTGQR